MGISFWERTELSCPNCFFITQAARLPLINAFTFLGCKTHVTAQLFSFQVLWEAMAHKVHLVLQDNQEMKVFKENLVPEVPQVS